MCARAHTAAPCTISTRSRPRCRPLQSPMLNHLDVAPPGGHVPHGDTPVNATRNPITIGGARVYGAFFEGSMGYRIDATKGSESASASAAVADSQSGDEGGGGHIACQRSPAPERAAAHIAGARRGSPLQRHAVCLPRTPASEFDPLSAPPAAQSRRATSPRRFTWSPRARTSTMDAALTTETLKLITTTTARRRWRPSISASRRARAETWATGRGCR